MHHDSFFNSLGKRVRILRQDMDLTQTELRDRMEKNCQVSVGQNHISELERGVSMPSAAELLALAKTLQTSTDYLLMLSDTPDLPGKQAADSYLSPEADEVARLVDALPAAARGDVVTLVRTALRLAQGQPRTEPGPNNEP